MKHNCFVSSGSWQFSHTPYRSTPHQQVSLQPHDYASIPWLSEPSSTVISRQPSKSPREYVTAFPEEKCSQENLNGTASAERWVAGSKSLCHALVHWEPELELPVGRCLPASLVQAGLWGSPSYSSCRACWANGIGASPSSRPSVFFRRPSCFYWEHQYNAFIRSPCVTAGSASARSQALSCTGSWRCFLSETETKIMIHLPAARNNASLCCRAAAGALLSTGQAAVAGAALGLPVSNGLPESGSLLPEELCSAWGL